MKRLPPLPTRVVGLERFPPTTKYIFKRGDHLLKRQLFVMDHLLKAIEVVSNQHHSVPPEEKPLKETTKAFLPYPILINPRAYVLNRSQTKSVSVGLKSHSNFTPVIEIYGNKHDWVVLEEDEWIALLEIEGTLRNYFNYYPTAQWQPINVGTKTVVFHSIGAKRVLTITSTEGGEVCLAGESLQELWTLGHIISDRIDILKSLEFAKFYANLIKGVAKVPADPRIVILDVIHSLKVTKSENNVCMLELLKYAPSIIECDVEIERVAQGLRE